MSSLDARGLAAARYAKSLFNGRESPNAALAYAESQDWMHTPHVTSVLRAAVSAQTTINSPALLGEVGTDFSQYVRPLTLLGKITGFRRVPMRVRLLTGSGGSTSYFVGEANPKPISRAAFANLQLDPLKTAGIVVVTQELLRFSTPQADLTLKDDLAAAAIESIDRAFIDPLNSGIANVKPASVTNGVTPLVSTGSTIAQIDSDLKAMVAQLIAAGSTLESAYWIVSPGTAVSLSLKRGTGGNLAYPGVNARGGELLGLPVATSAHMSGDSSGAFIALLDASAVALADEDEAQISVMTQGSLQLADNPSIDASSVQVSLWQTNTAAIRVERYVDWRLRRQGFVSVLSDVSY
ncbi:phage major capsid protein [Variovorax rhizosphaerae]|uniref:Phage major capsid protein n=1 Tax=Variovorax rhizosphaerae TaxID=1836200 RepID=A0ABU8WFT5_9BURK